MSFADFINYPLVQVIIIACIAFILNRFSSRIINTIVHRILLKHKFDLQSDRRKQENTVASIFRTTGGLFIWLVAAGVILTALGFNLAEVAAGAGFLGIIIGLGAQATIRDYLAGIFILLENQYRVGDIITLNGGGVSKATSGVVEDITLRITKLRDLDGTLHTVRNGEASIITNRTFQYSSVIIDVKLPYDSDIDLVEKAVNRIGKDMLKDQSLAKDIKEPIKFLRVDDFGDSAVIVRLLGKVVPAMQWDIAGEYRRRLLKAFQEQGIEIAFPQVVVHEAPAQHRRNREN